MSSRGDNSEAGSVYGSAGGYSWFGGSLDDFEDPDFLPPPPPELLYPALAAPVFRQARSRASTPSPPPPPVNRVRELPSSVALPPFRVNRPASWFDTVNDIFRLKGVRDQRDRLTFAVSFFAEEQLQQIDDLLELRPRPADIFDLVRDRLVGAHALDDYQRLELLLDLPPLGGQKPSALLAQMRQLCPTGEENTKFFRITFLRRLPPAAWSITLPSWWPRPRKPMTLWWQPPPREAGPPARVRPRRARVTESPSRGSRWACATATGSTAPAPMAARAAARGWRKTSGPGAAQRRRLGHAALRV